MNNKGFTVIETVTAMLIGSIIIASVYLVPFRQINTLEIGKQYTDIYMSDVVLLKSVNSDLYRHGSLRREEDILIIGDIYYEFKESTKRQGQAIAKGYTIEGDSEITIVSEEGVRYKIINPY